MLGRGTAIRGRLAALPFPGVLLRQRIAQVRCRRVQRRQRRVLHSLLDSPTLEGLSPDLRLRGRELRCDCENIFRRRLVP